MRRFKFFLLFLFLPAIVSASAPDWQLLKSTHFFIYYKGASQNTISDLAQSSEGCYNNITEELGFNRFNFWTWDNRARIYILDDPWDYQKDTGAASWSAGQAVVANKLIKTFVTAPGFLDNVLPHEMAHIIFREMVGFNNPAVPLWLEEGVATYQGEKISYEQFVKSRPAFFWYDPFGRLVKFQNNKFVPQAECGKPVIYLYPQTTTKVAVRLDPQGGFTASEPSYGTGWNVFAQPNGQLTEISTGKNYPYLFWEGRGAVYQQPQKGFVVVKSQVEDFLQEKLTLLGLNEKERADFLDFWLPRMQSAPYYFVTFLGNSAMNAIAPLEIFPKPDTVIRVLMDFSPLEEPISVEGFNIKTPERKGFTVVEWGGVLRGVQ